MMKMIARIEWDDYNQDRVIWEPEEAIWSHSGSLITPLPIEEPEEEEAER